MTDETDSKRSGVLVAQSLREGYAILRSSDDPDMVWFIDRGEPGAVLLPSGDLRRLFESDLSLRFVKEGVEIDSLRDFRTSLSLASDEEWIREAVSDAARYLRPRFSDRVLHEVLGAVGALVRDKDRGQAFSNSLRGLVREQGWMPLASVVARTAPDVHPDLAPIARAVVEGLLHDHENLSGVGEAAASLSSGWLVEDAPDGGFGFLQILSRALGTSGEQAMGTRVLHQAMRRAPDADSVLAIHRRLSSFASGTGDAAELASSAREAAQAMGRLGRLDLAPRILAEGGLVDEESRAAFAQSVYRREGVDLTGIGLDRAKLNGIRLVGGKLRGCNLRFAQLRDADLTGSDMSGCDLSSADLTGANLSGAILREARLDNARLSRAILRQTDLSRTSLLDTDLQEAIIDGVRLAGAVWNGATRWPLAMGFRFNDDESG
jgi:uncharacterized protein YjbI with pentapeptide repeats